MKTVSILIVACALLAACSKYEPGQKVRVKSLDGSPIGTVVESRAGAPTVRVRHPDGRVADYAEAELVPVAEKD